MSYDYSKLRGRIREKYGTQAKFAEALGVSTSTLSQRLTGLTEFTQEEIAKSSDLLGFEKADIPSYFFTAKV